MDGAMAFPPQPPFSEVKREELRALTDAEAIAAFNALDMPPELVYRSRVREEAWVLSSSSGFSGRLAWQ